jgi:hypothetical protein
MPFLRFGFPQSLRFNEELLLPIASNLLSNPDSTISASMFDVIQPHEALVFRSDGVLCDTSTLNRIDTGDPQFPVVYVTPDGAKAFFISIDAIGTLDISPIGGEQFRELARKCKIHASANSL